MMGQVFIADYDLFRDIGGGQTVYGNLIKGCPETVFYYMRLHEPLDAVRPPNARPIPYRGIYDQARYDGASELEPFFASFKECLNIAGSVSDAASSSLAPEYFDVIDTPDYRQNGLFIRQAFELHGLRVGQISLALHGLLSTSLRTAWPWRGSGDRLFAGLVLKERLQYHAVDTRYALSSFYAEELSRRAPYPVTLFDPLTVIRPTVPTLAPCSQTAPELVFVGRKERRKGPDLVIDLAWTLQPGLVSAIRIIGPDGVNHQGSGSKSILQRAAELRGLVVDDAPAMGQAGLESLWRAKTILVVPSRYDQFNLTALEGLLAGCPTLVGRNTGVAQFIETKLPELSHLISDFGNDRDGAKIVTAIAGDYERARSLIVEVVQAADLRPDFASLRAIYSGSPATNSRTSGWLGELASQFLSMSNGLSSVGRAGARATPTARAKLTAQKAAARDSPLVSIVTALRPRAPRLAFALEHPAPALARAREIVSDALISRGSRGAKAAAAHSLVSSIQGVHERILASPERTQNQIAEKIAYLNQLVDERRVDRVRWFGELARLERKRGRDLIGATYDIRVMRWLGGDRFGRLASTIDTLGRHGFDNEASFANAMWSSPKDADERIGDLLEGQDEKWRGAMEDRSWDQLERHNSLRPAKISVIVSIYAAGDKLRSFLSQICQQTALVSRDAELILVDSASPDRPWQIVRGHPALRDVSFVFARSAERETIQTAWNRGLRLATGDYVAFLGVDEGLRPDALARLAEALDANPSADWAMADSFVTRVNRGGVLDEDVMRYDRSGFTQDLCYLESTYLAYVGGLYRKTLHERVGWYDESFKAAGDTEFKNRALPFIRVVRVPETLGVFYDYPEVRMSGHPRAEIEDLRAWYAHRTLPGLSRAFPHATKQELEKLLRHCLGYRKTYAAHQGTDIDLAVQTARLLNTRFPSAQNQLRLQQLGKAQTEFRALECWSGSNGALAEREFLTRFKHIKNLQASIFEETSTSTESNIFSDNRYEQHHWSWSKID